MLLLLSPAKTLDFETAGPKTHSQPVLLEKSLPLIERLRKMDSGGIQQLMKVSENIATLNVERYRSFSTPFDLENAKQAAFAFKGDVYRGLEVEDFTTEELEYAQQTIGILSGLYGLLRPLDLIQPYRLEMKTRLDVAEHKNLYEYWGSQITDQINALEQKSVVNVASKEYFKAVKPKELKGDLWSVEFKERRNGVYKIISFNAKHARGLLCRYAVKNRLQRPEELLAFDWEEYTLNKELSEERNLVFTRG